jgi:hypothetical protein
LFFNGATVHFERFLGEDAAYSLQSLSCDINELTWRLTFQKGVSAIIAAITEKGAASPAADGAEAAWLLAG